jgi:hypothetical protein
VEGGGELGAFGCTQTSLGKPFQAEN